VSAQEITDAYLRLMGARRVLESNLSRVESAFICASPAEIEMAIAAYHSAGEVVIDRLREQVFAQLRDDGIDPITRRRFR
jgi:hypothetical protein